MGRCKRMQGEYKMYLVQQIYKKQQRKEELETTRERQTQANYRQSYALRDQVAATAVQGRKLREPVGMDARYKEYLADERNAKRAKMMQSWNIYIHSWTALYWASH